VLRVDKLRAGYGSGAALVTVLREVSLAVEVGEIVALLGSNGAGKSTLINAVTGILRPASGRISFEGADISSTPSHCIVAAGLVQVPEGRRVFPNLSVKENLLLGGYRRARERRAANLARVMGIFPRLGERLAQKAGTLSGGEQQMLAIGRALMSEPRLLILDEPSLGLAPIIVEEMFGLISQLHREGLSILLVEQNAVQSLEIAQRAYVLEQGAITISGTAQELASRDEVRRAYLGLA
jgi:branched-chain amino acid transport system ATP-binding protein